FTSFIGLLDFPGLQSYYPVAGFEQLAVNLANERIQDYVDRTLFQIEADQYRSEGVHVPSISYQSPALDLLVKPKGICHETNTMTDLSKRVYTDNNIMDSLIKFNSTHPAFSVKNSDTINRHFIIQHYGDTPVEYATDGFIEKNNSQVSVDFLSLFKGGLDVQPSWNSFIVELFANVKTQNHPKHNTAIIAAQQSAKPMRNPSQRRSTRRKGGSNEKEGNTAENNMGATSTVLSQIQSALDELMASFEEAKLWTIYCLLPKYKDTGSFDSKLVQSQIDSLKIPLVLQLPTILYVESYNHQEFLDRYAHLFQELDTSRLLRSQCEMVAGIMNWTAPQMSITQNKVFLSAVAWRELEDQLRSFEKNYYDNDNRSYFSEDESGQYNEQDGSLYGSESYYSSQHGTGLALVPQREPVVENLDESEEDETTMSTGRKRWLWFVYFCTFFIPSKCLIWCGRMKRKDIRVAWREKFTLCFLIFLLSGFVIFFLVFFSEAICPTENIYTTSELQEHDSTNSKGAYVAIRGEVFHLTNFAPHHYPQTLVPTASILQYGGTDATAIFPVQVSALCEGVSPYVSLDYQINYTDTNAQYHDFRYTSDYYNGNWYYDQMTLLRKSYKLGNMGYDWDSISDAAKSSTTFNGITALRIWAVIDNRIYDLTTYTMGGRYAKGPGNTAAPSDVNTNFLNQQVVDLFQQQAGNDITSAFNSLDLDDDTKKRELACLRNLYFVGYVDERNSTKCKFSTYLMLVVTCLLASVIIFKFVAAIRFGATIAGTYGLQALLFVIKGRWEFIMWMLISILALPVFSFYIPIYSYWHFDDFSWGNTRVVVGDKGKKVAVSADDDKFDPKTIPTMKWSEYEQQVLSEDHWSDNLSHSSGYTHGSRAGGGGYRPQGGSVYGGGASGMMMMPADTMSMHSAARSSHNQPRQSMGPDHNSMVFPSSASIPLMAYNGSSQMLPSSRSMASFAPAQQLNSPGQYIPLQTSPQFNKATSNHSLMMDGFGNTDGPNNEEIMYQVQRILETADLAKITKKQVREELQETFGVSMQSRKDYINACIENVLQNHA
ncbi:hypothetical protein CU098_005012, partial [Rhizopus stolonifer]